MEIFDTVTKRQFRLGKMRCDAVRTGAAVMARKRRVWCVRDGFGAVVRGGSGSDGCVRDYFGEVAKGSKGCVRMVFVWSGAARQSGIGSVLCC